MGRPNVPSPFPCSTGDVGRVRPPPRSGIWSPLKSPMAMSEGLAEVAADFDQRTSDLKKTIHLTQNE